MKKNLIMVGIAALVIAILALTTDIKSPEQYYLEHMEDISEDSETVSISISCATVLNHMDELEPQLRDEKYVPSDGWILPKATYVLRPKDTAFDLLKRACQYNQIQMEFKGANTNVYKTVYVEGINYLYEFACGDLSGWTYRVNGQNAQVGAGSFELHDGDYVEWMYTCDLGRDVGMDFITAGGDS